MYEFLLQKFLRAPLPLASIQPLQSFPSWEYTSRRQHQINHMALTMLAPSRTSTSSSSSNVGPYPQVTRQNTLSSSDGTRSARASKRYSVTALYMSMHAHDKDIEIEDDLARGLDGSRILGGTMLNVVALQFKRRYETSRQRSRHNRRRISC